MDKELTIRDIKWNIKNIKSELEFYLTKKQINYNKTQPGAISYKEIMTSGGKLNFDRLTHYVIRDSEYDDRIYSLEASLNAYEKLFIEKVSNISDNEEALVKYLKDEEKKSWKEIYRLTKIPERTAQRYYSKK